MDRTFKRRGVLPSITCQVAQNIGVPAKLEPIYEEVCTFRSVTGTCRNPKSDSWLPIAVLIADAHHLNELNHDCLDPIAPCLLAALGDYHPSCKLRLGKFRLPTLRENQIRQYELNLIQNPHLHALSAEIQMSRDVNDLEVMDAVRYAPRLDTGIHIVFGSLRNTQC